MTSRRQTKKPENCIAAFQSPYYCKMEDTSSLRRQKYSGFFRYTNFQAIIFRMDIIVISYYDNIIIFESVNILFSYNCVFFFLFAISIRAELFCWHQQNDRYPVDFFFRAAPRRLSGAVHFVQHLFIAASAALGVASSCLHRAGCTAVRF